MIGVPQAGPLEERPRGERLLGQLLLANLSVRGSPRFGTFNSWQRAREFWTCRQEHE